MPLKVVMHSFHDKFMSGFVNLLCLYSQRMHKLISLKHTNSPVITFHPVITFYQSGTFAEQLEFPSRIEYIKLLWAYTSLSGYFLSSRIQYSVINIGTRNTFGIFRSCVFQNAYDDGLQHEALWLAVPDMPRPPGLIFYKNAFEHYQTTINALPMVNRSDVDIRSTVVCR